MHGSNGGLKGVGGGAGGTVEQSAKRFGGERVRGRRPRRRGSGQIGEGRRLGEAIPLSGGKFWRCCACLSVHQNRDQVLVFFVGDEGGFEVEAHIMEHGARFERARDFGESRVGKREGDAGEGGEAGFVEANIVDVKTGARRGLADEFGHALD